LAKCFGDKCGICGLVDHPIIYDFHHLDPNSKDMQLSARVVSWKKAAEEARKCVMLCSHCHRKVHKGMVNIPDNIQKFDERLSGYEPPLTGKYLTEDKVRQIKVELINFKYGIYSALAKEFNTSPTTIRAIHLGERWKDV
jgi:hypothetical protein